MNTVILISILLLNTCYICYNIYKQRKEKIDKTLEEDFLDVKPYDLYDIDSFHKRMYDLRNTKFDNEEIVDGVKLYQVSDIGPKDYTDSGVEVITESMEMDIEKRIRS